MRAIWNHWCSKEVYETPTAALFECLTNLLNSILDLDRSHKHLSDSNDHAKTDLSTQGGYSRSAKFLQASLDDIDLANSPLYLIHLRLKQAGFKLPEKPF